MRGDWIGRPGRIRAVVFDFDGTLALTPLDFAAMRARVVACADRRGLPPAPGRLPILEMIEATAARAGARGSAFRDEARSVLEADETAAARNAVPVPGAAAALERLRSAGLAIGIITRNCRAAVEPLVRRMAIPCDALLTRDDVAAVKPDPVHLRSALRRLGVPASRALVVGDHPFDVRAARRLGMPSAAVLTGGRNPADFLRPRADVVLEDVAELPVCLGIEPLPSGKLQNRFLGPLLDRFAARRADVPVGPGVGLDCAVLASPGRFILGKADPITLVSGGVGPHLLAVNANDIAAAGGRPRWLFTTFLFPVGTTIAGVREVFEETAAACRAAAVAWAGGHSEVTDRVAATVASGCLLGVPIRARPVRPSIRPGDRLLQIREIGIEGAAIIARECGERLAGRVSAGVLRRAANALVRPGISAAAEAREIWRRFPVRAMHDPTEGGTLDRALRDGRGRRRRVRGRGGAADGLPAGRGARRGARPLAVGPHLERMHAGGGAGAVRGGGRPLLRAPGDSVRGDRPGRRGRPGRLPPPRGNRAALPAVRPGRDQPPLRRCAIIQPWTAHRRRFS